MAKRAVTINFFRIAVDGERKQSNKVQDALKDIAQAPAPKRVYRSGGDHFLLGAYKKIERPGSKRALWCGQLRRLRPNDRVAEGDEAGYFGDVPLGEGRSVTEVGHFMMIPDYRTVLWQGSPQQVGWTSLRAYVQSLVDDDERIIMVPVLKKDQVELFRRIAKPTKCILKVAMPDKWSLVNDPSIKASTKTAADFAADHMTLELKSKRGKTHALAKKAKDFMRSFAKAASSDAELAAAAHSIYLEGYTADDDTREKVALDFVEDRLLVREGIDMDGVRTVKDWSNRCYAALENAYDSSVEAIRATFDVMDR